MSEYAEQIEELTPIDACGGEHCWVSVFEEVKDGKVLRRYGKRMPGTDDGLRRLAVGMQGAVENVIAADAAQV